MSDVDDLDEYALEDGVTAEEFLPAEVTKLRAQVAHLRHQEALKNIALGAVEELRRSLNEERIKVASLRNQIEEMVMDMSLMEDQINDLSGRKNVVPDYPDA